MHKIIWLTDPSGAGKTTLAKALLDEIPCVNLDGNEMRNSISRGAGFSRKDRGEHNLRVARLAKVLSEQMTVVVSVIAPVKVIVIPDIEEAVYGRKVGWGIRQIILPEEIEAISATAIRKGGEK